MNAAPGGRALRADGVRVDGSQWASLVALVADAGLPVVDMERGDARFWLVLDAGGEPVGCFGLERAGPDALLRSVVVRPELRGAGLGLAVVALAESTARALGARRLALLTESAGAFFERLGYRALDRAQVPEAIRRTEQFRNVCPVSATCMSKLIAPERLVTHRPLNILFLCTGNSARSILAEAIASHSPTSRGRFRGFSAGSHPTGRVNPFAIEQLRASGIPVDGLRSKSWDEFALPGAPELDFVVTVCDAAVGEVCPYWPGRPSTAHWGVPDPAAVEGDDEARRRAFAGAFVTLKRRIERFAALPLDELDAVTIRTQMIEIGKLGSDDSTREREA